MVRSYKLLSQPAPCFCIRRGWVARLSQSNNYVKYEPLVFVQDERPHDNLNLCLVKEVKAIPPDKNTSMFHFAVHFSGYGSKSQWLLRAYTKVY